LFVHYTVGEDQRAYGLKGSGFALIAPGSACFVPFGKQGEAYAFGGSDAFLALTEALAAWDKAKRPGSEHLRIRLLPHKSSEPIPQAQYSQFYPLPYHYFHAWLDF